MKHSIKSTLVATLALVAILLAGGAAAQAQTAAFKLGVVSTEEVIAQLPEMKDIDTRLQALQKQYADTLRAMQGQFEERVANYQKGSALMKPEAKTAEETALNELRNQILQYQQEANTQFVARRDEMLAPVRAKIKAAVERVAKDEKLTAVVENGMMLYYDTKIDITFKVLDYLRRGN